jgi:hypothetical protein
MSTAADAPGVSARSPEERAREVALGEVSDVLLNLEHSLARARRALAKVRKGDPEPNIEHALVAAIAEIEKTRKRLMQDTYYAGDALRLL